MSVRIVDVREITKPIASSIRNAYIDFSKMTTSLVAVVTDAVRDGRRVVGYGFNSNGRYGQGGLIRERFAPRIMEADPKSLLNDSGDNFDADRIWSTMMSNEKPGGHGERSVAVGTIDMAVWDAVAKIAGMPLFRLLADGCDLDRGYSVVKMKIGGADLAEDRRRIEAVLAEIGSDAKLAADANGRFDLETAIAYAKALTDCPLFWYESPATPSTIGCKRPWRDSILAPWQPAKTCSATRTPATSSAMAACAPTATGCSSTAHCPMASANTIERWRS